MGLLIAALQPGNKGNVDGDLLLQNLRDNANDIDSVRIVRPDGIEGVTIRRHESGTWMMNSKDDYAAGCCEATRLDCSHCRRPHRRRKNVESR